MSVYFKEGVEQLRETLATLVAFNILWNIIFFPASYIILSIYFKLSNSLIPFFPFALLALGTQVMSLYKGFIQVKFRLSNKPYNYLFFVVGYRLLAITISLYFVVSEGLGLQGRMIGLALNEILFLVLSIYIIFKSNKLVIKKEVLKKAYKIVLPLLPASFLYLPVLNFDNIVLERMDNPYEMGLYNIGKGIANYIYVALFPFFQAFEPEIYNHAANKNLKALKKVVMLLVIIVVITVMLFILLSPLLISYLTAGKYTSATKYANILAVTSGLMILFSISDAIINATQKTRKSLISHAISATLCIILYSLGGRYFEQIGVAVATVLTYLFLVLLQVYMITFKEA
ncbi:lipopolysaccharide biosynthesis protein [Pontibacter ummariensis]|nr:polysaccharide biosynthesis C-terminal domain-containing protein [Pontibacter ummariensis]